MRVFLLSVFINLELKLRNKDLYLLLSNIQNYGSKFILYMSAVFILIAHVAIAEELKNESLQQIAIGLLPGGNPEEVKKQSFVLANELQSRLNHPVKLIIAKDYQGLVEALKTKKVDFAFLSSSTFVVAEKQVAIKTLLKKTWNAPFYFSTLLVKRNSKIKSVKDFKNKSILFVDEQSTSGYLYPQVYLHKNHISDENFKSVGFSGNHAASIEALENDKADIVAVFSNDDKGTEGAWTRFSKKNKNQFRTVWISDPIPNDPIVVRQDFYELNPKLVHEVMFNLIEIQSDLDKKVSDILGAGHLMPATTKQYDPVREMHSLFENKIKDSKKK